MKYFPGMENNKQSDTVTGSIFDLKTKINEKNMNIITDKTKAPAKLRYRVSNNSGTINKEFGKNQQVAYDFANEMKETATIRGYFVFKHRGQWQTNTVFIDHVFK